MDNDYELIYLAKEDENLKEVVYQKYKNLIYKKIIKYSNLNNIEDYLNESRLIVYETIDNYIDKAPFIVYLNKCLDSRIYNYYCKTTQEDKLIPSNSISLDKAEIKGIATSIENPEEMFINKINYINLKQKILNQLTWKEELVFELKEQNYQPKEIAEITDNNKRNVYNIIKRIKEKISNIMSNESK